MRLSSPLFLAAGVALLVSCSAASGGRQSSAPARHYETLEGTVTYFERMALPQDARLVVRMGEDGHLGDPGTRLAEREFPIEGQVPVPFDISYAADAVDPSRRYVVEAEILVAGRPWFVSPAPVTVLEGGVPSPVAIVVQRTSEGVPR